MEKGKEITDILKFRPKETLRNLWDKLRGYMIFCKPVIVDHHYGEIEIRPAPT
jgi:hypothetical protein